QILFKADRIHNVPTVHAESLLAPVQAVRLDHLRHAKESSGERAVFTARMLEVPSAAEIVFGTGSANRREFLVSVHIELDFAFAPPAGIVDLPCNVCTYIV